MKCHFCKKEIEKEDAYMWIHISKSGKEYKKYCCSEEEKYEYERDLELYKKCQYETDAILGRPITNNARNKELKELHEAGYSWEQIYRCVKSNAQHIKDMIAMNHIENDYQQIRYCMQVIKNVIYDYTKEDERKNSFEQYKQVEEEVSEEEFCEAKEESEEEIISRLKRKEESTNNINSFLNGLK